MEDLRQLKPVQLDALREVANIGAGHAATALSQMIGETIMISVPTINVSPLEEVPPQVAAPDEPVAAVLMHMLGDLTGRTLLVFPKRTALRLAALLMRKPPEGRGGEDDEFTEMDQSAIKEAGNILSSAYMNALSDFMGMMLLPSPPSLAVDMSNAVLTTTYLQFGTTDRDYVFCVESEFLMNDTAEKLRGFFLLLPDPASLQAILKAVRVA
jgi:chemotaxis protein CheC